jgi:hypothetical protein
MEGCLSEDNFLAQSREVVNKLHAGTAISGSDVTLGKKLSDAERLFALYGEELSRDVEILSLLAGYREANDTTGEMTRRCGVVEACTACAKEGPGSCCFSGIEDGYDAILLLINLLLGCELPKAPVISGSCFFVGEHGCRLAARYYFCLHYLCPALQEKLGASRTEELCRVVGDELSAGWKVEMAIRRRLKIIST